MTVDWTPFMPSTSATISPSAEDFPCPDAFDDSYLADTFGMQPDYSLDEWVVPDFFERPAPSMEAPVGLAPKSQAVLTSTLPAAAAAAQPMEWQSKAPFGELSGFDAPAFPPTGFPYSTLDTNVSATPSLCGDSSQDSYEAQTTSPATSVSTATLKREPPAEDAEEPEPKRVARKRGRPRLHRPDADASPSSYAESQKHCSSRRLPHNQVERKYREGLNSELERLRRAVPTLPQRDSSDLTGPPKPSKATVLASAIDYIKFMEAEHERLAEENERLRGIRPLESSASRARSKLQHVGWSKGRAASTAEAALNA